MRLAYGYYVLLVLLTTQATLAKGGGPPSDPTTPPGWVSWVGSLVGLPALVLAILNWWLRRSSEKQQAEQSEKLAELKAKLEGLSQEANALRDYQYNARKRLYRECLPILFQLLEAAEPASRRITSLARASRSGSLSKEASELVRGEYYLHRTIYTLFAPLALFVMLRSTLTGLDLSLDADISLQYQLAKMLYRSFTHYDHLARCEPKLKFNFQRLEGLTLGDLDNILDGFIVRSNKQTKLISFAEFEERFSDDGYALFRPLADLFVLFKPKAKPVLWRVLIAQAYIYRSLLSTHDFRRGANGNGVAPKESAEALAALFKTDFTTEERERYQTFAAQPNGDRNGLDETFEAARGYYRKQFSRAFPDLDMTPSISEPVKP